MRTIIRPAVVKIGNTKHIGWHIFRHTYSSLMRANRTDIKVTQNSFVTLPAESHWIPTPKWSRFKSESPKQCHSSSACVQCDCWMRRALCLLLFLVCAYINNRSLRENIGDQTNWAWS